MHVRGKTNFNRSAKGQGIFRLTRGLTRTYSLVVVGKLINVV